MQKKYYDIKNYEGLYLISKEGKVLSNITKKELKQYTDRYGYLCISLYKNKKAKKFKIHRLLAINFLENKYNKPCVDHINTIKTDNNLENLRWVTWKENSNNKNTLNNLKILGEKFKTDNYFGKPIINYKTNTKYISIIEAHRQTGCSRSNIQYHLKNKTGVWGYA